MQKTIIPKLVAIIVGDDPASKVYVNSKRKAFKKLDCLSESYCLSSDISESDLIEIIFLILVLF